MAGEIGSLIDAARRGLRLMAWGREDEWTENDAYRYAPAQPAKTLSDRLFQDMETAGWARHPPVPDARHAHWARHRRRGGIAPADA